MRYPAPREANTLVRYAYKWDFANETVKPEPVPSPNFSQKTGVIITEQEIRASAPARATGTAPPDSGRSGDD